MVQYIPNTDPWSTIGALLGQGVGQGYQQRVKQNQQAQALKKAGIDPSFAALGSDVVTALIKNQVENQELAPYLPAPGGSKEMGMPASMGGTGTPQGSGGMSMSEILEYNPAQSGGEGPSPLLSTLDTAGLWRMAAGKGPKSNLAKLELDRRQKAEEVFQKDERERNKQSFDLVKKGIEEAYSQGSAAELTDQVINRARDLINKGNFGPGSSAAMADILEKIGPTGEAISMFMRSPEAQELGNIRKSLFMGASEGFPAKGFTQFFEKILESSVISSKNKDDVNLRILDTFDVKNKLLKKRSDLWKEYQEKVENKEMGWSKASRMVDKDLEKYSKSLFKKTLQEAELREALPPSQNQNEYIIDDVTDRAYKSTFDNGAWKWIEVDRETVEEK